MFNDRIERLAELDRRVGYWDWCIDEQWPHHVLYDDGYAFSVCETESADALPTHAKFIVALRNEALPLLREMAQALSEARAENERLRARQAKLKETLLPVCEYAAEIYNRGIPAIAMPDDTIQRLNWAFKMFGG